MTRRIGSDILERQSSNVPKPNVSDAEFKKFLEKKRKSKTQEDVEEKIKYHMPEFEGEPSDQELIKQRDQLLKEKNAFDA